MAATAKKKTPSPTVMAARWVREQLLSETNRSGEELGAANGTRVSDEKAIKVADQIEKLTKKLIARCDNTIAKFEG